jgi:hypothetical protein
VELAHELVGDGDAVRRIAADRDLASDDGVMDFLPVGKLDHEPWKVRGAKSFIDH